MMEAKEVIRIGRSRSRAASYRFKPPLTGFGSTRLMAVSSYRLIQGSRWGVPITIPRLPQFRTPFSERGQVLRPTAPLAKVCYWGQPGKHKLTSRFTSYDPTRTH
jgi:hypothetical protein